MRILSGNMLKILGAVFMLIDHIGVVFFPEVKILRILGRISFPIFAFMIAEGCRYTRNKLRYLRDVGVLAFLCQVVYYVYDKDLFMCILVTFTLSIILIYALQAFKNTLFDAHSSLKSKCITFFIWIATMAAVYGLNQIWTIDYGFWGCMTPMFVSMFMHTGKEQEMLQGLDKNVVHVLMLAIALYILGKDMGGVQMYALLSLPFLLIYSGKRGQRNMKNFFYVFYPTHLALLQGLSMIL